MSDTAVHLEQEVLPEVPVRTGVHVRHRPEETVLHQVLSAHFDQVVEHGKAP